MRIHWFNPENDLALASGQAHYTAPQAARELHDSGAALPLWYGDSGDRVLCYGINGAWLDSALRDFRIDMDVFDHRPDRSAVPSPWGWSAYAREFFAGEGFAESSLPSVERIARLRELSHRRTGARVSAMLAEALPDIKLAPPARECTDMEQVRAAIAKWGQVYLKMPWSSSGRGVLDSTTTEAPRILQFAETSIRRQGSVMVEPAHSRLIDFAKLYKCERGQCSCVGTSVFTTDTRGTYTGNLLAPETERLAAVTAVYPEDKLSLVTETLRGALEKTVAADYDGIVGVDMLVDREGMLDAVVEVNLRKTMGYVASRFADRYMAPGARGTFTVSQCTGGLSDTLPYHTESGLLTDGAVSLTPPGGRFSFVARIDL